MKTKSEAEIEAQSIVDNWATAAALTGWIPLSGLFLAGADMIMIRQVADTFGVGGDTMGRAKFVVSLFQIAG